MTYGLSRDEVECVRAWKVEIASVPGIHAGGVPDRELATIGALVEDAVERGVLLDGDGSGSADGRIGGTWTIEAVSAEEAVAIASKLLRTTLREDLELEPVDAIVDYVSAKRATDEDE